MDPFKAHGIDSEHSLIDAAIILVSGASNLLGRIKADPSRMGANEFSSLIEQLVLGIAVITSMAGEEQTERERMQVVADYLYRILTGKGWQPAPTVSVSLN